MNYQCKSVVYGLAYADTVLAANKVVPGGALILTPKVRLSKDPAFAPVPGSLRANLALQECDFSGYAAGGIAPTISGVVNLSTTIQGQIALLDFIATAVDPFVSARAYGWWLDDGVNMVCAEKFPSALTVNFGVAGDYLALQIALPLNLYQDAM